MFSRVGQLAGAAIDHAARLLYWKVLGLRIPSQRIRISDLRKERDFCEQRLAAADAEVQHWSDALERAEEALETAEWEHNRLLNALDATPYPRRRPR